MQFCIVVDRKVEFKKEKLNVILRLYQTNFVGAFSSPFTTSNSVRVGFEVAFLGSGLI